MNMLATMNTPRATGFRIGLAVLSTFVVLSIIATLVRPEMMMSVMHGLENAAAAMR